MADAVEPPDLLHYLREIICVRPWTDSLWFTTSQNYHLFWTLTPWRGICVSGECKGQEFGVYSWRLDWAPTQHAPRSYICRQTINMFVGRAQAAGCMTYVGPLVCSGWLKWWRWWRQRLWGRCQSVCQWSNSGMIMAIPTPTCYHHLGLQTHTGQDRSFTGAYAGTAILLTQS